VSSPWDTLARCDIRPHESIIVDDRGPSTGDVWEPAALSTVDGWDGLEGDSPDDLDVSPTAVKPPRARASEASATAQLPASSPVRGQTGRAAAAIKNCATWRGDT